MEYINQVILGACLDVLKKLPDECIDACVTDPPYGLGEEPTLEEIIAYLQGADLVTGDFMGKDWEIPSVLVWREVYRVLKPGGYVLSFGGTRTFDLISLGLRAAGFEKRDSLSEDHPAFPALQWKYGQGMPKSHNVSKAIDKKKGAKRTVVRGVKAGHEDFAEREKQAKHFAGEGSALSGFKRPWMDDEEKLRKYHYDTAPATPEAAEFDGYGTGLKPSWEPILVFRKPFKGTVAENVLKYGTGSFNIDSCRVKHSSSKDLEKHKAGVDAIKARGGSMANSWKNSSDLSGASEVTSAGRWPPNSLMTHAPGCCQVGTRKVKSGTAYEHNAEDTQGYHKNWGRRDASFGYANEDGQEEITAWACVEGCPVAELDAQSGDRPATLTGRADPNASHVNPGDNGGASTFGGGNSRVYADDGGASKYFPQFGGTEDLYAPFLYTAKPSKRETSLDGLIENKHPTRKPLKLMKWLVRLVARKGAIVLDPYCGSGSTLHAAAEEGMRYVGIERDKESHATASKRMAIVNERVADQQHQQDMFDAMGSLENEP